ncbi:MAG: M20/M25/M40 family metallo-hydrolase [Candidatus Gastranaerophilales bacterium]|nr:M20/M25/M40 family metallo-hydrolase [Candidatus Gastranaerophilales bacterium]
MLLETLAKDHSVLNTFIKLVKIPSPSFKEEKVAKKITDILKKANINVRQDSYGNVIAVLEANNSTKPPLLLSAHMDVVGGSEPVNLRLSEDGKFIETDKTRTLGADDKAGVAVILDVLIYLKNHKELSYPKIEAVFTRDEEFSMTGVKNLDASKLEAQNALMLDGSDLGECNVEGAGFVNLYITVKDGKGGHSGIDIDDDTRASANKVLAELMNEIPQGVYKKNSKGVITSINSGALIGGSAGAYLVNNKDNLVLDNPNQAMSGLIKGSFVNIIATNAFASYSIRSSELKNQQELIDKIQRSTNRLNKKYSGKITIESKFEEHLKPFVKDNNDEFVAVVLSSAHKLNIPAKVSSFHAGAETHVMQNDKLNANNQKFKPLLLGIADIYNMHSNNEKVDHQSLIKGRDWILEIILNY